MNLNEMYPSRFLKASDLKGRAMSLVIDSVYTDSLNGESKHIVSFKNTRKELVLNRTNASVIGEIYGPDTDQWISKPVELYKERVSFQGKIVDAIRVRAPLAAKPVAHDSAEAELEADIPL